MSFNIFGPASQNSIRVGYISTERGFIDNVTICEANDYAKLNPGTQFVFKTRNFVKYLNINEVNKLTPDDVLSTGSTCGGIVLDSDCGYPQAYFYGGGGVGVQGNPVIGADGSLLAVDIIHGGFGYQYPPIVEVKDKCGVGVGAVTRAVLGEIVETVEYYDQEGDFEEYELCDPTDVGYGLRYGPNGEVLGNWDPTLYANLTKDPIAIQIKEYQDFIQQLQTPWWTTRKKNPLRVTSGNRTTRIKHNVTYPAWSDFLNAHAISPVPPSNAPGSDFAGQEFTFEWEEEFPYDGEYVFRAQADNIGRFYLDNQKLLETTEFKQDQTPKSLTKTIKAGVHRIRIDLYNKPILEKVVTQESSGLVDVTFDVYGEGRNSNTFIAAFTSEDGKDSFILKGAQKPRENRKEIIRLKPNIKYKVSINSSIGDVEQGTIVNGTKNKEGGLRESNKIFGDRIGSDNDNDDIQITALSGTFTPSNKKSAKGSGRSTYDLTFLVKEDITTRPKSQSSTQSDATQVRKIFNTVDYIGKANRQLWRLDPRAGRDSGFINQYGILPFDPTSAAAQTESFSGVHTIVWDNITFPIDGNYNIEIMVDDDVTLTFTGAGTETVITKRGFSAPAKSTGKSLETRAFKKGSYKLTADLTQIKGRPLSGGNPMALAVNVETTFNENEVVSPKSWNENPMGVTLTIDAPMPPIPQEPIPLQEGRCPNNPIWTTRFPNGKQKWWPVNYKGAPGFQWSQFMNRYAISPIPPLARKGTDGGGIVYRNEWEVDIPYDGFYAFKSTVDNAGRILVDDKPVMQANYIPTNLKNTKGGSGVELRSGIESIDGGVIYNFRENNPKSKKVFLSKGKHKIQIEVENGVTETFEKIDKKVFSTKDWLYSATSTTTTSPSKINPKFITRNGKIYLEVSGSGQAEVEIVMDVNDTSYIAGLAAKQVVIPSDSGNLNFARTGTTGKYSEFYSSIPREETIKKKGMFTAGKTYGPIEIIGASPAAGSPKISSNGNKLGLLDADGTDENIKIIISSVKNGSVSASTTSGLSIGTAKDNVVYEGPTQIANYVSDFISPLLQNVNATPNEEIQGKTWKFRWSNVDFPVDGQYTLEAEADDRLIVRVNGIEVGQAKVFEGRRRLNFNATRGKKTVELELSNIRIPNTGFDRNPVVGFAQITVPVDSPTGVSKPWTENPMGISAILIPPPCPKRIKGRGVVTDVVVDDPGNGFPRPGTGDYPVALRLKNVVVEDPGINYSCGVDQLQITPSNGAILDYECDTFGRIINVKVLNPGLGFTNYPEITLPSNTGINATFRPQFEVIRDPIVEPQKLIQVTDLVGLKQTGYVGGRPYYGAVFYKDGIRYAGFYETPGDLVQVYDTLQESIDARVTTPPSAIQRQGTDVTSNDPRLNLPGTPENLI